MDRPLRLSAALIDNFLITRAHLDRSPSMRKRRHASNEPNEPAEHMRILGHEIAFGRVAFLWVYLGNKTKTVLRQAIVCLSRRFFTLRLDVSFAVGSLGGFN